MCAFTACRNTGEIIQNGACICANAGETVQNGVCTCPVGQFAQSGACVGKSHWFDHGLNQFKFFPLHNYFGQKCPKEIFMGIL